MASKLGTFNQALLHLKERKLASLSENREVRRALDDAWETVPGYCLEQGFWNFAMRSASVDASASVTPAFGLQYAFLKPEDWIRTFALSPDESFATFLRHNQVIDEAGYWYGDSDPLWVRYISNSVNYGMDLSRWPWTFAEYVAARLAVKVAETITEHREKLADMLLLERRYLKDAKGKDAMNEPPGERPVGSWVQSRSSFGSRLSGTGRGL